MATSNLNWTLNIGADNNGSDLAVGWVNTLIGNLSTSTPISDRFGGGDGGSIEGSGEWLDNYGDKLILYAASDDDLGVGELGVTAAFYTISDSPAPDPLLESDAYGQVKASVDANDPQWQAKPPSIIFDGSDGKVIMSQSSWDGTSNFEVVTVANISDTADDQRCIYSESLKGSTDPYIELIVRNDETIEVWAKDAAGTSYGPAGGDSILTTGWHTIGMSYDGTDVNVYVDTAEEATSVTLSGSFTELDVATIGALRTTTNEHFYDDRVGRVLFYSKKLSSAERVEVHKALKRRYPNLPSV